MKKYICYAILFLLLITACRKAAEYETLTSRWPVFGKVYEVKDGSPDSAMILFHNVADTMDEKRLCQLSPFLFNEYELLKVELRYKNYLPVGKDSLMDRTARFYDSIHEQLSHDEFLLYQFARALYYKAVVESQRGQIMESYSDFLHSLDVMDGLTGKRRVFLRLSGNIDYEHFTALIYTRLASFLYRYDAWDVALEMLEKSNESFELEHNSLGIADNYELMGDIMIAQSDRPAALRFYKSSDSIRAVLKNDNIYQHYSTLIHHSIDLFNEGMYDSVYRMLHRALDLTEDSYLTRKICYSLGYFYYENHVLDSALSSYERGFPLLPRQTTKALCRIIQISNELGDTEKAALYGEQLAVFELEKNAMAGEKTKMITLYEQYKSDKKEGRNKNIMFFILGIVVILLLLLIIDSFLLEWRRRRHREDKEQHQRIRSELEGQIVQTMADTMQKDEKILELEAELEKAISNPDFQKQPFNTKMDVLRQMPICKRVLKILDCNLKANVSYPELALTDHHLSQVIHAVDTVFPKFSIKLIEQYPRMKRSDVMYCCLYLLGINEIQAAALTGISYQAVWKRSVKLHEIFGNKSDFQFVLYNILKDWN